MSPLQNFSEYTPGFALVPALISITVLPDRRWDGETMSAATQCLDGSLSNAPPGVIMWRGASPMNALHDKTVDCLDIRFAVTRGRHRLEVLGLRLHGSPAKNGASRMAIRGLAETPTGDGSKN